MVRKPEKIEKQVDELAKNDGVEIAQGEHEERLQEGYEKLRGVIDYVAKETCKEMDIETSGLPSVYINLFHDSFQKEVKRCAEKISLEQAKNYLELNMFSIEQINDVAKQMMADINRFIEAEKLKPKDG